MQLLNERAPEVDRTVGVSLDVLVFSPTVHSGLVPCRHQLCGAAAGAAGALVYGASMLCFHSYVTVAWNDAGLTSRTHSPLWFIPFMVIFEHIKDMCMKRNPSLVVLHWEKNTERVLQPKQCTSRLSNHAFLQVGSVIVMSAKELGPDNKLQFI